jgi:hypothetical protein
MRVKTVCEIERMGRSELSTTSGKSTERGASSLDGG